MKIAFYSPLKSPNHPIPSGDRLMARQLMAALRQAGHIVEIASELRSFFKDPDADPAGSEAAAAEERVRLGDAWRRTGVPDLWFCYHPYYKAPDLLGPELCQTFGLAYVTAEASYSERRNIGHWASSQARLRDGLRQAAINLCFTVRDHNGLAAAEPQARLAMLSPFIDSSRFLALAPAPEANRLVTVAMMRPGDKIDSFTQLSAALQRITHLPWTLSVVGDGPCRAEVEALFAGFDPGRIDWHGQQDADGIAELLARGSVYVWPGCGEAYGLAYLEAQAAGLPVVAYDIAGVPAVVGQGRTGLLTPVGDIDAYAAAIAMLLTDVGSRQRMAEAARIFGTRERSLDRASLDLDAILRKYVELKP